MPESSYPREEIVRWLADNPFLDPKSNDLALLQAIHTRTSAFFPEIITGFYDQIRSHPDTHRLLADERQYERLARALQNWLIRLCTEPRTSKYWAEISQIGAVHVHMGVPMHVVISAMTWVRESMNRLVAETFGEQVNDAMSAINGALDADLVVMIDSYHEHFVARIRKAESDARAQSSLVFSEIEHRYVNAVELAPYVVVGVDRAGKIQLFNAESERVTGFARDEVKGLRMLDCLIPEDLRDDFAAEIDRDDHVPTRIESMILTRAGQLRTIYWHIAHAPSNRADGVVVFAIGRDTTDEASLAERTKQAEKLAAVGTLAAGLAHEIRNPLNGAQLHVTFLERGLKRASNPDPSALEAVGVVREELTRLGNLVSEFLDFARPQPLARKAVSITQLCKRVIDLKSVDAEANMVLIRDDLPKNDIRVDADAPKIEQVLLNLLANAIEAMSSIDGGVLTVRARRAALFCVIEVEDSGPGIPTPNAPIFDAFFSTKAKGTGLGLAIAHRIITDHGGSISFESRPGCTIFRFTLKVSADRQNE